MGKTTNQIRRALRRACAARTVFIYFHDDASRDAAIEHCRQAMHVAYNWRPERRAFTIVGGGEIIFATLDRDGDGDLRNAPDVSELVPSPRLRPWTDVWVDHEAGYRLDRQQRRAAAV